MAGEINFIKLVLKNVIKLAKGSLSNIFQDSFSKILSQQFTHERSYIISTLPVTECTINFSFKADVEGWSDDGPLSVLPLLDEDSDSEDEEGNQYQENDEEEYDVEVLQTTTRKKKVLIKSVVVFDP